MPKRQFDFSPSVQLILSNLPTIRNVQKLLDEGTVSAEIKQCLKYLAVRLGEEVPEVKDWQSEISGESLYFYPRHHWRVVRDDYIAVCISMDQCIEPAFYNCEDDPFVGLYVPSWKHLQSFTNQLKGLRIPGFEHISGQEALDMDEHIPLWSRVDLPTIVRQARVDLNGLEKAIIGRARELITREKKISKLILTVRQHSA